jgi:hypothetical protein
MPAPCAVRLAGGAALSIPFHWRFRFFSRTVLIRELVTLRQTFVRHCQNCVTHATTPVLSGDGPAGLGAPVNEGGHD